MFTLILVFCGLLIFSILACSVGLCVWLLQGGVMKRPPRHKAEGQARCRRHGHKPQQTRQTRQDITPPVIHDRRAKRRRKTRRRPKH